MTQYYQITNKHVLSKNECHVSMYPTGGTMASGGLILGKKVTRDDIYSNN